MFEDIGLARRIVTGDNVDLIRSIMFEDISLARR